MDTTIHLGRAGLPDTRREMPRHMKKQGEASVESLAGTSGTTVSGARQHLTALERDGLVSHRVQREGAGRPRHVYTLTAAGDTLFPRNYAELANELLAYVDDEDPLLVERIFARRGHRRLMAARARTAGLPFAEQVKVIAQILDEDGYLADFEQRADGTFVITEYNCAVLTVAQRYGHACSSEWAFLADALPDAEVIRVAHRLAGAHVCAYLVQPHA